MGINDTPVSERFTIGIFGKRNVGKSSLINALTSQKTALTSEVAGTTTDPVSKTMELLPIGPVVIIDTAGLDDEGTLGKQRVDRSFEVLRRCNLILFVCDATRGEETFGSLEEDFIWQLKKRKIPCIIVLNKCGMLPEMVSHARENGILEVARELGKSDHIDEIKDYLRTAGQIRALAANIRKSTGVSVINTDAEYKVGIEELKLEIIAKSNYTIHEASLTEGIVNKGDIAVLVTPIDSAAPKGRMILPQQQVLRDILDKDATAFVTKESDVKRTLSSLKKPPNVVITDSQAFRSVAKDVPDSIPLTSFSILFARQKGDIKKMLEGVKTLKTLKPGDIILISEACTHHKQKDDIGTVKIPKMIKQIQPGVEFEWQSGAVFPKDISKYKLIIHCGACMINNLELLYRIDYASEQGVPITNYGLVLAYGTGILEQAIKPFGLSI